MLDAIRLRVLVAIAKHGSVTAAAQALNYAQPSVSHHVARLEAETGAKLIERSGRGIRLTDAGRLLAARGEEILGRLDAAEAELAAHVGLRQERIRLAAFGLGLCTLAASAAAVLHSQHPDAEIRMTQAEPPDALRLLRAGEVDVALVYRYLVADGPGAQARPVPDGRAGDGHHADPRGGVSPSAADVPGPGDAAARARAPLRSHLLVDEPVFLITPSGQAGEPDIMDPSLAGCRWIAGCRSSRDALVSVCRSRGFVPEITVSAEDPSAMQALVAAGLGVAILPALALRAGCHPGIRARQVAGARHQVHALTYQVPPDPEAARLLVAALEQASAAVPPQIAVERSAQ